MEDGATNPIINRGPSVPKSVLFRSEVSRTRCSPSVLRPRLRRVAPLRSRRPKRVLIAGLPGKPREPRLRAPLDRGESVTFTPLVDGDRAKRDLVFLAAPLDGLVLLEGYDVPQVYLYPSRAGEVGGQLPV